MDDAFMYTMHADNLCAGRRYADTCYVVNPENPYVGPASYPPGYPAVICVVKKLGGGMKAIKAVNALSIGALALTLTLLPSSSAGTALSAGTAALVAMAPALWEHKDLLYSDIIFTLLLYLALLLHQTAGLRGKNWISALEGFVLYIAYAVRPLGALLPAAFVIKDFYSGTLRGRAAVLRLAFFSVPVILQALFFPLFQYTAQLHSPIKESAFTGAVHVLGYFFSGFNAFWTIRPASSALASVAALPLTLLLLGFYAAGAARRFRVGKPEAMDIFTLLYIAAIAFFGMFDGVRYVFPLVPFLTWKALENATEAKNLLRRAVPAIFVTAGVLFGWSYLVKADYKDISDGPTGKPAHEMFGYLSGTTKPDDTIIFFKPRTLCYFTGRKSSIYPPAGDDEHFLEYFRKVGAGYLVVSRNSEQDRKFLYEFVRRNGVLLEKEFENSDFKVYRIKSNK